MTQYHLALLHGFVDLGEYVLVEHWRRWHRRRLHPVVGFPLFHPFRQRIDGEHAICVNDQRASLVWIEAICLSDCM
jgi:hypothetical protein